MQLTKLDRWLKERFIYETHIFTLRLPEGGLPKGARVEPFESNRGGDYKNRIIIKDNDLANDVIEILKNERLMYATHVVDGKHWYNKRIAPEGQSFTFRWINRFVMLALICAAAYGIYLLLQNEELVKTVKDSIDELKAGM